MPNAAMHAAEHLSLLIHALMPAFEEQAPDRSGGAPQSSGLPSGSPPPSPVFDARVQQAERLLLSGELLASLSHEVNNALMGLLGNIDLLRKEALPTAAHSIVQDLALSGQQLHHLLESMLDMARGTPTRTQCELGPVVANVIRLVAPLARDQHVTITHTTTAGVWMYIAPPQIQQVLLNLLINSLQAISSAGGHIWLNTSTDATHVMITVRDDGPGVPKTILTRIFDPFFSTKPANVGTGLGLAIVRSILEHVGGTIEVTDARPGRTTFTIRLLRAPAPSSEAAAPSAPC